MSSRGLLDIKQNTGTGAESLQEQLGTILVQNPNPTLGAQDNHTHPDIQDGAGQNNLRFMLFGSRSTSDLVVDVGVGVEGGSRAGCGRGPGPGFRGDTLVQRQGSDRCSENRAAHTGLAFPTDRCSPAIRPRKQ